MFTASLNTADCNKFSTDSSKTLIIYNNECFYGFTGSFNWNTAREKCEAEGTHLVHYETETKQTAVNTQLFMGKTKI